MLLSGYQVLGPERLGAPCCGYLGVDAIKTGWVPLVLVPERLGARGVDAIKAEVPPPFVVGTWDQSGWVPFRGRF